MTNTADLEQLCARLEDEREELKDRSRITGAHFINAAARFRVV